MQTIFSRAEAGTAPSVIVDRFRGWRPHLDSLAALLSPGEREIADRFLQPEKRERYVIARAVLRGILARECGVRDAAALPLDTLAHGKPVLRRSASQPDLRFNLSRSSDHFAIALAVGRDVGIDVLSTDHEISDEAARLFLSPGEQHAWKVLPVPRQREFLQRAWTRKEALAKAIGSGLAMPLTELDLGPWFAGAVAVKEICPAATPAQTYAVVDLPLADDCRGAVAMAGAASELALAPTPAFGELVG